MKVLFDSGVWWRRMTGSHLSAALARFIENEVTEAWLCPVSVYEIQRKVALGKLPEPMVPDWEEAMLRGFRIAPLTVSAAHRAASWAWEHRDPFDRLLAAIAATEGLTLLHTDMALKGLTGFPQRYFRGSS